MFAITVPQLLSFFFCRLFIFWRGKVTYICLCILYYSYVGASRGEGEFWWGNPFDK